MCERLIGHTDDLVERGVEPIGDLRAAERDAADRPGVASQARPSVAHDQFRGRKGRGTPGGRAGGRRVLRRAGPARTSEASMLTANAADAPFGRPRGRPGELRRGLRRLRPPAVTASVRVTRWTGRSAAAA